MALPIFCFFLCYVAMLSIVKRTVSVLQYCLKLRFWNKYNPRANGAECRPGRKAATRVLIPPGYLHPEKGTH
jgi:hypothetical protein